MPHQNRPKPVLLLILDGWGIAPPNPGNAITLAKTPFYDSLVNKYPTAHLQASGEYVGLPKGEDGNTETGHLNIGAGRIVYQDLPRINHSIATGDFFQNPQFNAAINHSQKHQSQLHLIGLIGSGGVHSSINHLYALLNLCKQKKANSVMLHLITDGRDSPPTSCINYINSIYQQLKTDDLGQIATVMGRYYAMDRDHRWERTQIAYDALTKGVGDHTSDIRQAVQDSYQNQITDEFIKPLIHTDKEGKPLGLIKENDAVIFYNFRIDRPRQLTKAFVYPNFEYISTNKEGFDPYAIKYYKSHVNKPDSNEPENKPFERGHLIKNLYFVTMTQYESNLPAQTAFPPHKIDMPLGQVISEMGLRQLRMSETEKERFVTYYFNGQQDPYPGEDRIIIPSPPVATYDLKPEMSSYELTETLLERLETNNYDFILINYANPDMVAHTGNLQAAIKSAEVADIHLKTVVEKVSSLGGITLITADHGNIEEMINLENGEKDTEHSIYPVPLIVVADYLKNTKFKSESSVLGSIAPTILTLMNLPIPKAMTSHSLL